jgi:hypothetical protein
MDNKHIKHTSGKRREIMIFSIRADTEIDGVPEIGTEVIFQVGCRTCTKSWKVLLDSVSSDKLGFIFRFEGRLEDESRVSGYYITEKRPVGDKVGEISHVD